MYFFSSSYVNSIGFFGAQKLLINLYALSSNLFNAIDAFLSSAMLLDLKKISRRSGKVSQSCFYRQNYNFGVFDDMSEFESEFSVSASPVKFKFSLLDSDFPSYTSALLSSVLSLVESNFSLLDSCFSSCTSAL